MARFVDEYEHRFTATGVEQAASAFDRQGDAAQRASGSLRAYSEFLQAMGPRIESAGDQGLAAVKSWLSMAGEMEQARVAFTTLLGDANQASKFVEQLQGFAAETPFEFRGLQQQAKRLLAVGFAADDIIPMLTDLGDAAGALGVGSAGIDRLVLAFGQMRAMGKPMGDDLRQIAQLGVPAHKILREAFQIPEGTSIADASITAEQAITALREAMRKSYGGGMEAQSRTLAGSLSNLQDHADLLKDSLGEPLINSVNLGSQALASMTGLLREMSPETRAAVGWTTLLGSSVFKAGGWALTAWRDWKQYTNILRIAENTKRGLTAATQMDIAAERTKTGVAKAEAAAIKATSQAALGSARAKIALARSGGAMGYGGLVGGGVLGGAMAAGGGALIGLGGAALAERWDVEGWGAAGLGAGTTLAGAAQGYALAGPMGAVVGGTAAAGSALWKYADTTNKLVAEQEQRTGLKGLTEAEGMKAITRAEVEAGFAAMTPEQRARRQRDLTAQAATLPSGDITFRISADDLLTSRAATNHLHLR